MIVGCKYCGNTEIVTRDIIEANAGIFDWEYADETGELVPNYDGQTDVLWDSQKPANPSKPYYCSDCDTDLGVGELVVVPGT